MIVEEQIARVEEILGPWREQLGSDDGAYRNHVYRVVNFCLAIHESDGEEDREKIFIAACFHDLGIWSGRTFDYLPPSIALAKEYLRKNGLEQWSAEIEAMIDLHHKIRPHHEERHPLIESFRRSDLVDVSLGVVTFGLPRAQVRAIRDRFPNAGFHKRLVTLGAGWFSKHPLNPLPVLKW